MKVTGLNKWIRLAACLSVIAVIWGIVLPQLAKVTPIRRHIELMEAKNINVGAMFYSELEWQPPR
jgi:hypothetical protein